MTQEYIGRKIVTAWPEQNSPDDDDRKEGYAVKYSDGYISWCPKDKFEEANIAIGNVAHLPPFHQRLIAERAAVASDLSKLEAFLKTEPKLGPKALHLLNAQLGLMTTLVGVLDQRLELLVVPE